MLSRQTYNVLNVIGLYIVGCVSRNIGWNQTEDIVTCSLKKWASFAPDVQTIKAGQIHKC